MWTATTDLTVLDSDIETGGDSGVALMERINDRIVSMQLQVGKQLGHEVPRKHTLSSTLTGALLYRGCCN